MKTHLKIIGAIFYALGTLLLYNSILKLVSAKNDIEVGIGVLLLIAHIYLTVVLAVKSLKPLINPVKNEK